MDIDFESALTYPMESENWIVTVLVGGLLTLFSFLLVPIFLVYGYVLRVFRSGIAEDAEPPVFDDWGELLVQGLVAFVVILVYMLVPLVVFGVSVGGAVLGFVTGSDAGVGLGIVAILVGGLVSTVLAIVFGYFAVVGLANYAHEGRAGAAFDLGTIRAVAFDRDYAVAFLVGVAFLFGAALLTGVLSTIPFVGAVVGVFVTFYAQVAAAYVWGQGYAAAQNIAVHDGPTQPTGDAAV